MRRRRHVGGLAQEALGVGGASGRRGRPRPSRPTMRRTIFQRKCDPRTRTSTSSPASSTCTRSIFTRVERSSGSASQYERKSCIPSKTRPVAAIAFDVERVADPPHEGLAEGRAPPRDLVEVAAADRRVPRVELPRHLRDAQQVDVGGQLVVERAAQRLGGEARLEVEVRHLVQRVDAGVGAARAVALEVACASPRAGPPRGARPARCARSSGPASRSSGCPTYSRSRRKRAMARARYPRPPGGSSGGVLCWLHRAAARPVATTSTAPSASTAASAPSAIVVHPRLLQPRRRHPPGGGRRGAPLARAGPREGARPGARLRALRDRPQRHAAQGPLRERDPQPLADPAREEHRPDGRLPAAARLPAHAHRGAGRRRAGRAGSRSSTCTSASPPASGSARWPSSPARASSPRCPSACPRSWPATTTTGARCCGPSSWTCSASAPPPAANAERERAIATFPSFFPQGALDRIYYRGPLRLAAATRCRLALSRVASDHLPVIVDFDL